MDAAPAKKEWFMVTAMIPDNGECGWFGEYEINIAFESEKEFNTWEKNNPGAKILRTSKTHKNAYEPEDKARI